MRHVAGLWDNWKVQFLGITVVSLISSFIQAFSVGLAIPLVDDFTYLRIADTLFKTGVFTNLGLEATPGAWLAPLYIGLLDLIAFFNGDFAALLDCMGGSDPGNCALNAMEVLFVVQAVLGGGIYILTFYTIKTISDNKALAFIAMLLVVASNAYGVFFYRALTETLAFFLLSAAMLFWVRAFSSNAKNVRNILLLGAFIGMASLTRPSYLYLGIALYAVYAYYRKAIEKDELAHVAYAVAMSALTFSLTVLPWMVRNLVQLDTFAITENYDLTVFGKRASYNSMSWPEYWVSYVYWLPVIGEKLASLLFDEALYSRLGFIGSNVYFNDVALVHDAIHDAGGIGPYIFDNLFKHLMLTIPIAVRGMWVGGFVSVVGLLCFIPVALMEARNGSLSKLLMFVFPSVFMVGFHAFASANMVRYNTPLIIVYAYCAAYIAVTFHQKWLHRSPKSG
ncbi:MAG: glycosyltransferase family 39 protein [Alphaproteobacteria bacterium]|nr:glycosyltransferase family 39 protein [Alphaproteobacteria bacterium]